MTLTAVLIGIGVLGCCVLIGYVVDKLDESKKAREREIAAKMVIARSLEVIEESLYISVHSKNMKTRLSRISVAIETCRDLIEQFPGNESFSDQLELLIDADVELNMRDLETRIIKHMDKSNAVKSISAKVNNAAKALADIDEVSRRENIDAEKIDNLRNIVVDYIHEVELCGLKDKAELLELKGNKKKAADTYCEMLFFLKKDHIDDALQEEEFKAIEQKINELRTELAIAPRAKARTKKMVQ